MQDLRQVSMRGKQTESGQMHHERDTCKTCTSLTSLLQVSVPSSVVFSKEGNMSTIIRITVKRHNFRRWSKITHDIIKCLLNVLLPTEHSKCVYVCIV